MHCVVIGSGIAGITFIEKCRQLNPDIDLTLITNDSFGYYSRPILSHGFSKANIEQTIVLKTFEQIAEQGVQLLSETDVLSIERNCRLLKLSNGKDISYDKLVIATGSAAFIPPPYRSFQDDFYLFNSLADLKYLRKLRQSLIDQNIKPNWAIIGGGLIGCELASDMALAGDQVSLYHVMDRLMERQLVEQDSVALCRVLQDSGVDVRLEQMISSIVKTGDQQAVAIETQAGVDTHHAAIVSCGFKPRIDLAKNCGLETGRGIKVNHFLQSDDSNIFALGDVAELPDQKLYAFILPIRSQAIWLAQYINGQQDQPWSVPVFKPKAKVHGFTAEHPYLI